MDYFDTGFCVRERSWHGKETLLADWPADWDEARRFAGIEWEPEERQLAVQVQSCLGCGEKLRTFHSTSCPTLYSSVAAATVVSVLVDEGDCADRWEPVTTHKAIVRSDTGFHLGTVGADWTPITHAVMGEIVEALLDQPNVKIDTMLSMKEGRQVAATVLLDEPYTITGDDSLTLPYLVLLNAHDGSSACKALATQVRVVCANTYQAASLHGDRLGTQFVFRHTSKVLDRIEEAKQAISGAKQDAVDWQALAAELAVLPAPQEVVTRFLSEFIPEPPAGVVSDRVRANIAEARSAWRLNYDGSPTNAAHYGTALGIVDASVEYLDHLRNYRSTDTLLGRQLLRPEPLKAKAVRIAREVCATA